MTQRWSWLEASRWRQISTIFNRVTLFSILLIYVAFYGLALIVPISVPFFGFAPNYQIDPSDVVLYGWKFPFQSFLYGAEPQLIGTLLFCLPLLCAAVAWIAGTVHMAMQRRWGWVGFSLSSVVFVIFNGLFMRNILNAFSISEGSPPNWRSTIFWIAAVEVFVVLFVPWVVSYLYLIEEKSRRKQPLEVGLTVLASFILASLSLVFTSTTGPIKYHTDGGWVSYFTAGFPLPFIWNFPFASVTYSFFIPLYLLDAAFFYGVIAAVKAVVLLLRRRSQPAAQRTSEAGASVS
jgi:MFS family permease